MDDVSAHRVPYLRRWQTLEVRVVRLCVLCFVSAAPCKQIQENLHGLIEKLLDGMVNPLFTGC